MGTKFEQSTLALVVCQWWSKAFCMLKMS